MPVFGQNWPTTLNPKQLQNFVINKTKSDASSMLMRPKALATRACGDCLRVADLKVQQANVEARRARISAEAGPALYLANLFGSDKAELMVRLITALLVLVLDPPPCC